MIRIWPPTWKYSLKRTNQKRKTTPSGFRPPKTMTKLQIVQQYRHKSSDNYSNRKDKSSTDTMTSNPDQNSLKNLTRQSHYLRNQKNKQLKIVWLNIITFSPDMDWRLGWLRRSGKTHTKNKQKSWLQPKLTNANWPKRPPNRWTGSDAKNWNDHNTAFFWACSEIRSSDMVLPNNSIVWVQNGPLY